MNHVPCGSSRSRTSASLRPNAGVIFNFSWSWMSKSIFYFGLVLFLTTTIAYAQNTVTGAFQGDVSNDRTGDPISGVAIQITSEQTGVVYNLTTDAQGVFYQGLLAPGFYLIRVTAPGFKVQLLRREIKVSLTGDIVPVPVSLVPEDPAVTQPAPPVLDQPDNIRIEINIADARRDGSTKKDAIASIPIGAATTTRSFDELALLLPGVAPPPQTIGDVAGPGVGPGVGSAGQFAVNGIRSRANNFTVDGSDNNDEDIGVRRQGFVALVPQPIESIQEFQIITLLAPAQFGRNIGAQVNAVSRAGGNKVNGAAYGFFNSDRLNSRNFFDTTSGNASSQLRSAAGQPVLLNNQPLNVRNQSGGEDSFTFGQGGAVLGGAIVQNRVFYFLSGEFETTNAIREKSFAVPTVDQRGAFGTGASGITRDFFNGLNTPRRSSPVAERTTPIFSLFPFPNNPTGVYGINTFTQTLPASGRGVILSGRLDDNFDLGGRQQTFTARYNFTDDDKDISAVNDAIFSAVRSKIRTNNLSLFLNSELSSAASGSTLFNQVRFSFGRTQLDFDELRDNTFLVPSSRFPEIPFLLNAPNLFNTTLPQLNGQPNTGPVTYINTSPRLAGFRTTADGEIGPIGQVNVAGFSSLGVDVYNFPQTRANNTFQLADEITWRKGNHAAVFGIDTRRTDLNSDLPRLARPLFNFNGSPRLTPKPAGQACANGGIGNFCFLPANDPTRIIRPEDLLSLGATSGAFLTFNVDRPDSKVKLRYYQLNFYAQDTWRIRPELSVSYGLRYEYNTPVRETNRLIEQTFSDSRLSLVPGLRRYIDGRTQLYEADRNNLAPRVSIAWSPRLFGRDRVSVFRAGYGLFYDQILGAVVNQSRNVFPTFLTLNLGGVDSTFGIPETLDLYNPAFYSLTSGLTLNRPGTLNIFNNQISLASLISSFAGTFPNAITATLPARQLDMPMAHHYTFVYEQQLNRNLTTSIGYVGTLGRNLLRFTTPNLGSGTTVAPTSLTVDTSINAPEVKGLGFTLARTERSLGAVNVFETTASSRYDSLQADLRGRFTTRFNFQLAYVFSKVEDDVSDVFDLAGASALPQNSITFAGERAPANFDIRHRFTYNAIYNFSKTSAGWLTDNLQIATTGRFRTGQPFTVNSIVDVNLDGNLTDRLNTTDGIRVTGNRRQPLVLTTANPFSMLAAFGQDGQVGRNSFRAGNVVELDLSVIKGFTIGSGRLNIRADLFNFINRANFGIPVRFLEAPGFGQATSTITPGRRVQFGLKYEF
jgi:hypothetical protein